MRRLANGAVEIEFVGRARARELAQAAQRDLDVARADLDVAVEILEGALVPHLHRAVVAVLVLPDAHALGVVAMGAEGRGAHGANPFRAALMALLLLREALTQRFHELLPAHGLDLFFLVVGEIFLGELFQPVGGNVRLLHRVEQRFEALERRAEHLIEAVEIALVLHQQRARQIVEFVDRMIGESLVERLHEVEVFARGDGHPRFLEGGEEGQEHGCRSGSEWIMPRVIFRASPGPSLNYR